VDEGDSNPVVVRRLCFQELEDNVVFLVGEPAVLVESSSFVSCKADAGGAVTFGYPRLTMVNCCGDDCSAKIEGNFANIAVMYGDIILDSLTLVACTKKGVKNAATGGISISTSDNLHFSEVNFTDCGAVTGVAPFVHGKYESGDPCKFWNVYCCEGNYAVDYSPQGNKPFKIEFGNFYGNTATALKVPESVGLHVQSCIFKGNNGDIGSPLDHVATITNCVFDNDFPVLAIQMHVNFKSSETASYWLYAEHTLICVLFPAIPPPAGEPGNGYVLIAPPSPSALFVQSVALDALLSFRPSKDHFLHTDLLSLSSKAGPSNFVSPSGLLTASPREFKVSAELLQSGRVVPIMSLGRFR
jgi:hypothetical protein